MPHPAIHRTLDAAILKPETPRAEAEQAIRTCIDLKVRTVCVRPCDIGLAQRLCAGSETGVCVVLGFPHGDQLPSSKADEARRYLELGVAEIDMVVNYGWARSGLWEEVVADIQAVSSLTKPAQIPLKVIFETCQLDIPTIRELVRCSIRAQADFVKTSTGFGGGGCTPEVLEVMVAAAAGRILVKASGGIRDRPQAEAMLALGAERLGVNWSSCAAICGDTAPSISAPSNGY